MRILLSILFTCFACSVYAQQTLPAGGSGNATSNSKFNGLLSAVVGIKTGTDTATARKLWQKFPSPATIDTGTLIVQGGSLFFFDGAHWQAANGGSSGGVSSVNGYTGAVDLTTDDIPQGIDNLYWDYADTGTVQVHGILTYTKSIIPTYLAGYGMGITANKTFYIDTTYITSRDRSQKLADSVAALIPDVSDFPTYGDLNDTAIARAATAQTNLVDTAIAIRGSFPSIAGLATTVALTDTAIARAATAQTNLIDTAIAIRASFPSVAGLATTVALTDTAIARAATAQTNLNDTAAAHLALIAAKQAQLNGTGFVKATGTTISYDNTSYYAASNPANYISSVNIAAGTGISVAGSVGNYTVANTLPDQTVTLTSGTGISATGVYPNFTITNTSPSSGGTITSIQVVSNAASYSVTPSSAITSSGVYSIIPTGTSSQFVKGDGSKDGTAYLSGTVAVGSGGTGAITITSVNTTPITYGANNTINAAPSGSAGGDLTGTYPNPSLKNTGTAGTYGSSLAWPIVTTDAQGRVSNVTTATAPISVRSITATSPLHVSGTATVNATIDQATTSVSGYLSSTDWNTFNGKGSGTVTSVGLVGSSTMSVTGTASPITGAGTYSLAIPASVPLAGSPTTTTQSAGDNSTKIATTAYVDGIGVQTITATSYTTSCTITTSLTAVTATVFFDVTAQAGPLLFNNPTGTWANHQLLQVTVKDNGTARALTYGTKFVNGTSPVLPTTTTISKMLTLLFQYDAIADKFRLQGYIDGQ